MDDVKQMLINEYGKDKLKVIEKDGTKYVDADFMNFAIEKLKEVYVNLHKLLGELEWEDTKKKVMDVVDGKN